jgi:hypothetical protein
MTAPLPEIPPPTFDTAPGVASFNAVYASDGCAEDHLQAAGDLIDDPDCCGWGED